MTEENGEGRKLPKGWDLARIGDLGEVVTGNTPSKKTTIFFGGSIPFYKPTDLDAGYEVIEAREYLSELGASHSRIIPAFSILVTCIGATIGKTGLARKLCATNQQINAVVASETYINSKWLFWMINSPKGQQMIIDNSSATTMPIINKSRFTELIFPVPPFNEQNQIVEKIEELFSELDQGIESLKTAQKQLKVYRQAVLKWAFEGKLTEEWRKQQSALKTGEALLAQIKAERENRYQQQLAEWEKTVELWEAIGKVRKKPSKPQKPKELSPLGEKEIADIPKLPEKWKWIQLGEFLDNIEAGKSFRCDERPPKNDETGVAKVSAVTWGTYDELESKTCLEEDRIEEKFLIESEDFLFSRANTIELVGACVIAQQVSLRVMLSDKTLRFKFPKKINQKFILYFLRSRYGRNEIERLATGNQESMRNIGQERILGIRTPFPNFTEQEQIVEEIESRLSTCDQLEATITENLQKAEALRQSILKQAFEGKLVPQDPNDEPAEKLLERIQAEREAKQPKTPKESKQLSLESL